MTPRSSIEHQLGLAMTLHIVNKGPAAIQLHNELDLTIEKNDTVILIEDGAYCVLPTITSLSWIKMAKAVYVLESDLAARGVSSIDTGAIEAIKLANHAQFVELTIAHAKSISWY